MTQEEWLEACEHDWSTGWPECASVENLLLRIRSIRKNQLFALACCRSIEDSLPDKRCHQALEVAERCIDEVVSQPEWEKACRDSKAVANGFQAMLNETGSLQPETHCSGAHATDSLLMLVHPIPGKSHEIGDVAATVNQIVSGSQTEHWLLDRIAAKQIYAAWQGRILVDLVGSGSELPEFNPEWRTSTVVALAKSMYESRDSTMPILGDALQDAGCEHEDILTHCRSAGPHVKGCWVVDLVLGKE